MDKQGFSVALNISGIDIDRVLKYPMLFEAIIHMGLTNDNTDIDEAVIFNVTDEMSERASAINQGTLPDDENNWFYNTELELELMTFAHNIVILMEGNILILRKYIDANYIGSSDVNVVKTRRYGDSLILTIEKKPE